MVGVFAQGRIAAVVNREPCGYGPDYGFIDETVSQNILTFSEEVPVAVAADCSLPQPTLVMGTYVDLWPKAVQGCDRSSRHPAYPAGRCPPPSSRRI